MPHRRFDLSLVAIAALLVLHATVASYGIRLARETAARTHAGLVTVASAGVR